MYVDSNSYFYSSLGLLQLNRLKSSEPLNFHSLKGSYKTLICCPVSKQQSIDIKTKAGYHISVSYNSMLTVVRDGFLKKVKASDIQKDLDYFILHGSLLFGNSKTISPNITVKDSLIPFDLRYSSKNSIVEYIKTIFNFSFVKHSNEVVYKSSRLYNLTEMQNLLLALGIFSYKSFNSPQGVTLSIRDTNSIKILQNFVKSDILNDLDTEDMLFPVCMEVKNKNIRFVNLNNKCSFSDISNLDIPFDNYLNFHKDNHFYVDMIDEKLNVGFRDCCYLDDNFKESFTVNGILVKQ